MNSIRTSALGLTVGVLVLGVCACSQAAREAREARLAERECVRVSEIESMHAPDARHVVVTVRANEYYVFTVDEACSGLNFAEGIAIVEATTRVCGDGFDFLTFNHPAVGEKRCRILKVESADDKEDAYARIESRPED